MSDLEVCATCKYWEPMDESRKSGECRRFPPVFLERRYPAPDDPTYQVIDYWEHPETWPGHFCGEWKKQC